MKQLISSRKKEEKKKSVFSRKGRGKERDSVNAVWKFLVEQCYLIVMRSSIGFMEALILMEFWLVISWFKS